MGFSIGSFIISRRLPSFKRIKKVRPQSSQAKNFENAQRIQFLGETDSSPAYWVQRTLRNRIFGGGRNPGWGINPTEPYPGATKGGAARTWTGPPEHEERGNSTIKNLIKTYLKRIKTSVSERFNLRFWRKTHFHENDESRMASRWNSQSRMSWSGH